MKLVVNTLLAVALLISTAAFGQKKFEGKADLEKLDSQPKVSAKMYAKHICKCMDKHSEDVKPALDQIAKMQKMNKSELSEDEKQKEVETLKEGIKKAKPFYDCVGGHPVSDEDKKLLEANIKKIYSCSDDQIIKFKTLVVSEYMNQYCDGTKALNFVYLSSAMANMPKK